MIRKIGLLFMLILLTVLVGGCWSRYELNDIAIVTAVSFDREGDQYRVGAQIVNPGEIATQSRASSKGAPVVTYSAASDTVFEAFRKMTTKSPRKLYFSDLRMLILSESLAKEGVGKMLDFLSRDHEFRTDFFIAVARGVSAQKILEVYTVPQEIVPANKMFKSLETSRKYWATTGKITLDEFIADIISTGKEPIVIGIGLTGDKNNEDVETEENVRKIRPISSLNFTGTAVFFKDKLRGWLDDEESRAYNYLRNEVKNTVESFTLPNGGKVALEVMRTKANVKGKVVNGAPDIEADLHLEANVGDLEGDLDLTKPESIAELEKLANEQLKENIEVTIKKVQKQYKSDIFGFGEAIHRSDPKAWRKLEQEWERQFTEIPVSVKVDVKIRRTGTISDSFMEKVKE